MSADAAAIQPLAFRMLIDEAMKLTRRHFAAIYPSVAIPISALYALFPLVQIRWMRSILGMRDPGAVSASTILGGCLALVLTMLTIIAAHTLAQTATIAAGVDVLEGRRVEMGKSWRFVLGPRVLGTLILEWIAVAISFLFCFFPCIYVVLALSLLSPVMAAEEQFGFAGIRRSGQLTRYNPHKSFLTHPKVKIFAFFCIGGMISWAVSFLVQLPFNITQQILTARSIASGQAADPAALLEKTLWLQIPSTFLGSLATMAVTLYTSFGLVLLYFDLRRRKEGVDLEAAIDRIAGVGIPPPAVEPE